MAATPRIPLITENTYKTTSYKNEQVLARMLHNLDYVIPNRRSKRHHHSWE